MDTKNKYPPFHIALVTALILSATGVDSPVYAAEEPESETIVVTGSRIRQAEAEGVNPVTTLSREDLERAGLKTVGDILMQLPAAGSALNSRFNSSGNFGFPPDGGGIGAGAAQVALRHLNPKRTLVLVDGIRWVNGSSASGVENSVDLNTIPVSMIEKIEILEDGASSIYGSDAIAGVVNIITRNDFDGFEVNLYGGTFDEKDGEVEQIDLSFGAEGDRHRVFFNLSHYDQKAVSSADRTLAAFPTPNTGLTRGSSGTPQGRFLFLGADNDGDGNPDVVNVTINDGVTGIPFFDPTNPGGPGDDFHPFTNNDRFNFSTFNLYVTPSKRTSIFAQAEYDITDTTVFYTKALHNNRKSVNQAAPEPIFIGPEAGTGGLGDLVTVDVTNPFNPFGVTLDASNFIFIGRRPLEGGPRVFRQDVDTQYIGTGFRGEFDANEQTYYWDINYTYGRSRADQIKTGGYNIRNILNALGPLADCQAIAGCVPLNLFGGQGDGSGTITQDMLDYIQFTQKDVSENVIETFSANISGDITELPAGPLSFAAGFERRDYRGFFEPDAVVQAGDSNGIPANPTSGGYDVDELYAEFKVPLLSGAAAAEDLSLTLAARNSDYSTFGTETTTKIGLLWRINEQFLFRSSVSEGFRAPGISELFATRARFDATLTDRCSNYVGTAFEARCTALGVPTTYGQTGGQLSVFTGGNPGLEAEQSDSTNIGFVYSPRWVESIDWADTLDFSLTYYKHEINDAIEPEDGQRIIDDCIIGLNDDSCTLISRTAGGTINGINNQLINIGDVDTSGYDIRTNYFSPVYSWGRLSANWSTTIVNEYVQNGVELAGVEVSNTGIPELKSTLSLGWQRENWRLGWNVRFIDQLTESCSDFLDGSPASLTALGLCSDPDTVNNSNSRNKLGSTTYHDLRFDYIPDSEVDMELSVGVNNVFRKQPPTCYSCSLNGYDPSVYDPEGTFFYVSTKIKF